eukprot:1160316-Pelagomonas_calceolata.AAC.10
MFAPFTIQIQSFEANLLEVFLVNLKTSEIALKLHAHSVCNDTRRSQTRSPTINHTPDLSFRLDWASQLLQGLRVTRGLVYSLRLWLPASQSVIGYLCHFSETLSSDALMLESSIKN